MSDTTEYLRAIKYPLQAKSFKLGAGKCTACGAKATFQYFDVINDKLADEWAISPKLQKQYSVRESMHCSNCQSKARLRALAKAITLIFDKTSASLQESIEKGVFSHKKIAEINACDTLHPILAKMPSLNYSEYASKDPSVKTEDLQKLSYPDNYFDLVLTSDTLEHVPDYLQALNEIYRVLKPGSYHLFTIPLIFSRNTRRRIKLGNDKMIQILEPSFHGAGEADNLVCTEFGIDFLKELEKVGFVTDIYFANPLNKNEVNFVLVSRKAAV